MRRSHSSHTTLSLVCIVTAAAPSLRLPRSHQPQRLGETVALSVHALVVQRSGGCSGLHATRMRSAGAVQAQPPQLLHTLHRGATNCCAPERPSPSTRPTRPGPGRGGLRYRAGQLGTTGASGLLRTQCVHPSRGRSPGRQPQPAPCRALPPPLAAQPTVRSHGSSRAQQGSRADQASARRE